MAFTVSHLTETVMGNMRVRTLMLTADATTQTVESGMGNIFWASFQIQSATAATTLSAGIATGWRTAINSNASGVQSNGVLGISNAVSGDRAMVVVFGRDL